MPKKLNINCNFGGQMSPFSFFIGSPEKDHSPFHFQADWLSKERGGGFPSSVNDIFAQLRILADKYQVPLDILTVYALGTVEVTDESSEVEDNIDSKSEYIDSEE